MKTYDEWNTSKQLDVDYSTEIPIHISENGSVYDLVSKLRCSTIYEHIGHSADNYVVYPLMYPTYRSNKSIILSANSDVSLDEWYDNLRDKSIPEIIEELSLLEDFRNNKTIHDRFIASYILDRKELIYHYELDGLYRPYMTIRRSSKYFSSAMNTQVIESISYKESLGLINGIEMCNSININSIIKVIDTCRWNKQTSNKRSIKNILSSLLISGIALTIFSNLRIMLILTIVTALGWVKVATKYKDYSIYSKPKKLDLDIIDLAVIDDILQNEELIKEYR